MLSGYKGADVWQLHKRTLVPHMGGAAARWSAERLAVDQNVCVTNPEIDHNALADLTGELRYLLNRWDPIGIYNEEPDFPPDEYDCLIGPILARLARRDSRASFSEFLWNEIENHFGLDPVQCGTDAFADRVRAWYATRNPASRRP